MKAAQVGATEAGNNWIGFAIHHAPGPMLAVQPTVELAKRNSRQRIDPLIEESPELRERVKPARSRDAGNTMLSKEFAGGILIMTGANSAVGLRSTPARYIFLDEVDAYPASADKGGDPVSLAEARSLMRLIDVQFLETPFFGVRQMTWHLRNEAHDVLSVNRFDAIIFPAERDGVGIGADQTAV
jgi:phage terminase large subunit GpA-like protein